jgi:hypothetical protein
MKSINSCNSKSKQKEDGGKKNTTTTTTTTTPNNDRSSSSSSTNPETSPSSKSTPTATTPPTPPPQATYVENLTCCVCMDDLQVDNYTFSRMTCCGKAMHLHCSRNVQLSKMSEALKSRCPECRQKKTNIKGGSSQTSACMG